MNEKSLGEAFRLGFAEVTPGYWLPNRWTALAQVFRDPGMDHNLGECAAGILSPRPADSPPAAAFRFRLECMQQGRWIALFDGTQGRQRGETVIPVSSGPLDGLRLIGLEHSQQDVRMLHVKELELIPREPRAGS